MKNVLILAAVLALTACGEFKGDNGRNGLDGIAGAPGAVITVPAEPVELTPAEKVLTEENEYRIGLGQTALTGGLSCTLYTTTGGDRIQSSIAGHNTLTGLTSVGSYTYKGLFNQPESPVSDGMNVLPVPFRSMYKNMYLLRCTGFIVVTANDYYQFDLASDDASLLYLGGSKLIDNDNNHGTTLVSGVKFLRKGVHAFRLDYAQTGGGSQSLILKAGSASGVMSSIDPTFYAH